MSTQIVHLALQSECGNIDAVTIGALRDVMPPLSSNNLLTDTDDEEGTCTEGIIAEVIEEMEVENEEKTKEDSW